ncbi:adenylate/guanylate cyclase domain-containing protein [Mycobacterium sp. NAZ190054]|uniref:ATP-binding protein n=1 Tax=Mycobacterium sp. NAZ190054 TaxID=1747766 RepID=UPI000792DBF3|nr:adenylate/guanylate cyclase domain-containing protein [Mycobacterium sp. NAZ190054]KWX67566.1 guanylate cyclase [Mycobacterium sp. NAZ190054]
MNDDDVPTPIDDLLNRAVQAINRGDRRTADALADQVLAADDGNQDAEDLLTAPDEQGEIRRLTIMFADLVDSTALSTRVEPEVYRTVIGRYREEVVRLVDHYEGHVASVKGDGLLVLFGHPKAHENDAHRAVYAGLDIVRAIAELSERVQRRFGFGISVRVGVHRGLVYLDTVHDDIYGLGANYAARVCSVADPGSVAVSEAIELVVRDTFHTDVRAPQAVKGVPEPITTFRVLGERDVVVGTAGPLVGREPELAHLRSCWEQARHHALGTPGVAFQGEGGVGKTRLAYAAVEMAQRDGAVVLGLFGSPFHTDVGLRPVRRLLERRCGIQRESDPAHRLRALENEVLQRSLRPEVVVPLLAPVLGIRAESGYQAVQSEGAKLSARIAGAVLDYLRACLDSGPALVLADDVHWFDPDTVAVLTTLLGVDTGKLMVVITGRTLPPLGDRVTEFTVQPLDDAEAEELAGKLHPELSGDARRAVRTRCDGIPLYIEEVVAHLKDQTLGDDWATAVPDTLYEALFARLRADPDALRFVGAAALIGSRFDKGLLSRVLGLDHDVIETTLTGLAQARVVEPVDKESWRFRHELLREVAVEVSPPTVRRRLHSRIADALVAGADRADPEWSLLAQHYESAARYGEAATAYEHASTDARRRGALTEARAHLAKALADVAMEKPGLVRDHREIELRLESGHLASAAQGHSSPEAVAEFERCLELIGPDPSPELYATLNALWVYYTARGDLRRSTQLAETLQAKVGKSPKAAPGMATTMGILAGFRGDFHAARDMLEKAAASVRDTPAPSSFTYYGPNDPIGGMYSFLAFVRFVQGDLDGAEDALMLMEARSQAVGFPRGAFSLCYGRSIEALVRSESGQPAVCAELASGLISLARQYDFDEWVMVGWSQQSSGLAMAALAEGRTDRAVLGPHIETMRTVVRTWRAFDVMTFLAMSDAVLARLLIAVGDLDEARDCLDVSLKMGQDTWIQFYDAELLRLRAQTFPDRETRHEQLCSSLELARSQGAHLLGLRSATDDFVLMGDTARQTLRDAVQRLPEGSRLPEVSRARALLR